MTPYHRQLLIDNAAEQARVEAEPTYYEPPWTPTAEEARVAREMAAEARARQEADAEAEREIKDPEAEIG